MQGFGPLQFDQNGGAFFVGVTVALRLNHHLPNLFADIVIQVRGGRAVEPGNGAGRQKIAHHLAPEIDCYLGAVGNAVMGAAAVLCLGLSRARGGWPKFSSAHIVYYVSSGCTRFVFAGFVMYTVLGHLPAGVVAIVIATAPLMTYLVRSALRRVRPDGKRGCGIVLGFVGVALLFVPRQALPDPSAIGWLALGFLTPLLYTVSNLAIERLRPPGEDSMALTSGMFVTAIVFSLPLAISIGQFHPIWETGIALREGAMFTHAVILAFCFFGLYELFRLSDATLGSQVTYLTAVSGVVFGIVLLGERPRLWVWAAVACIVAGMALVGRDSTPSPKQRDPSWRA